jgi:hypothetical protein
MTTDQDSKLTTIYNNMTTVISNTEKRIVNLGTGQSFNVSSYSKYQSLTISSFIIELNANINGSQITTAGCYGGSHPEGVVGSTTITKSYDSSTGILTAYLTLYATTSGAATTRSFTINGDVRAYLIIGEISNTFS